MSKNTSIFNLQSWKAIALSVFCVLAVALLLSWQYKKIEENSKEELSSLEDVVAVAVAQDFVDDFMTARMNGNEDQATLYLTENAYEQKEEGLFSLIGQIASYKIIKKERLSDENFKFNVDLYKEDGSLEAPEIIILKKINEEYYIDSIEVAG